MNLFGDLNDCYGKGLQQDIAEANKLEQELIEAGNRYMEMIEEENRIVSQNEVKQSQIEKGGRRSKSI